MMIALLILVSLACFAAMIYMNWSAGLDLDVLDLIGYVITAALPAANVVVVLLKFGDYITRHRGGIVLKGRVA